MPRICPQIIHFPGEKLAKNTKKIYEKLWNCPFNFCLSSDMNMQAYFISFVFSQTSLNNPCRNPSTVEYSECALSLKNRSRARDIRVKNKYPYTSLFFPDRGFKIRKGISRKTTSGLVTVRAILFQENLKQQSKGLGLANYYTLIVKLIFGDNRFLRLVFLF